MALGVIGALVVVGVAVWLVVAKTGASDPALSALRDACADEDWQACDDLFEQAEKGTDDRDFGDTCGGRRDSGASTLCVVAFAPEPTVDPTSTSDPEPEEDVDLLHDKCAAGDLPSCDDLYYTADWDSDDESFGDTCGETMPEGSGGYCETLADSPYTHGDDPDLDALWDACAAGDGAKCDDLFYDAVTTTDYENFGDTCGGAQPEYSGGTCGLLTGGYTSDAPPTYGADVRLDALWDACAAEDWESCDELYWDFDAPRGSGYWVFGATCGNRDVIDPGACEYEMD